MKRSLKILIAALATYLVLVTALLAVEAGSPDASIRTFGDALWYSIVTLTTVGYGDLTPVTGAGRVLGLLFALGSVGLLAALIALGLRLISGGLLPMIRLCTARSRPWYVFARENAESLTLARALRRENPGAVLVFPSEAKNAPREAVRLDMPIERLAQLHRGEELAAFYLGPESGQNYADALKSARVGIRAYCMAAAYETGDAPAALRCFDPAEALARCYWRRRPLEETERCVVLIGSGPAAEAILERALLVNVFPAGRKITYHCFSFGESFADLHAELVRSLLPDGDDGDELCFHAEDWTKNAALLRGADRVILCSASDEDNLRAYEKLRRWFVCRGGIDLRLSEHVEGLPTFGALDEILTPENVLREELDRQAILMHEIYARNGADLRTWQKLGPFLHESNIAAADHLPAKLQILLGGKARTELPEEECRHAARRFAALEPAERERLRETEHRRWLRFYRMYNWRYASRRNDAERFHPLLLPYGELAEKDRAKDDYAWLLLGELYGTERTD